MGRRSKEHAVVAESEGYEESLSLDVEGSNASEEGESNGDIQVEDLVGTLKEQLRELRSALISLRRATKSGSKDEKKAAHAEIVRTEAMIEEKKALLDQSQKQAAGASLVMDRTLALEKAAARGMARRKAAQEEEVRLKLEAELYASGIPQLDKEEKRAFQRILSLNSLQLHDIDPDGNCMFNAVSHQLKIRHSVHLDQRSLRSKAADYILNNEEKYSGFLEEPIAEYCDRIRGIDLWGGHLELDALCHALHTPIVVYQADVDAITFGKEEYASVAPLTICFQKYAYSLGEHYDSLVDALPADEDGVGF